VVVVVVVAAVVAVEGEEVQPRGGCHLSLRHLSLRMWLELDPTSLALVVVFLPFPKLEVEEAAEVVEEAKLVFHVLRRIMGRACIPTASFPTPVHSVVLTMSTVVRGLRRSSLLEICPLLVLPELKRFLLCLLLLLPLLLLPL
jgi:hypothetical protein